MSRRETLSSRPGVADHLHDHITVTRSELDAFVTADTEVRLLVLAELRARAADQEPSLVLALQASGLAVLAIFVPLLDVGIGSVASVSVNGWDEVAVVGVRYLAIGLFTLVVLAPQIWRTVKGNRDHGRAIVWLHAYEQAVAEHTATQVAQRRCSWSLRRLRS